MKKLIYILFPILLGLLWYSYSLINIKNLKNEFEIEYVNIDLPAIFTAKNHPAKAIYLQDSSTHNPFTNIEADKFDLKLISKLGFPNRTDFEFIVNISATKKITEEGRQYILLSILDNEGVEVPSSQYEFVATEEEHGYNGVVKWEIKAINEKDYNFLFLKKNKTLNQEPNLLNWSNLGAGSNNECVLLEYYATYQTKQFKHTVMPRFKENTSEWGSEDKNLLYTYLKDSIPSNQKEVLSKNIRDVKINYFRSAEDTEAIALERAKYLGSVLMGECLNYSGGAKVDKKYMPDIIGNFAYPTEVFVDSLLEKGVLKVEFGMQKK